MRDLIRLAVLAVVLVIDGLIAARELITTIRRVWWPPAPPVVDPLLDLYEELMSHTATELRAIAPRGMRRATKHEIAIALIGW
jgi:hypothetical protein